MEIRWIEKILLVTQIIKLTIIATVLSENNLNNRQQLLKNNKIETKLLLENHNNDNLIETNYNLNKFIKNQNNEKFFSNNNIKNTNYNNNNNENENENNINVNDDNSKKLNINENQPHSRKKRLIWVTDDGRLALPPGTQLSISPTVSLPLVRYPPNGFLSNISFNFPITMDLDKLGLTDNQNPLGDIPFFSARTFGRAAGTMLGNYISSYLNYRSKRDLTSGSEKFSSKMNDENFKINSILEEDNNGNGNSLPLPPELPDDYKHAFHGGERALLYGVIEDLLSTFGLNGTACLLRAICEIHSRSIHSYGFFGETVKLLLTPTKSPFAEFLTEHVKAQRIGEGKLSPGECFPYYKDCSQGLFKVRQSYREDFNLRKNNENENFNDNNDIDNDIIVDEQTKTDKTINKNKKLFDNLSM